MLLLSMMSDKAQPAIITAARNAWWEDLEDDVYQQVHVTEIDQLNPWRVASTAALDLAMRSGLSSLLLLAMGPRLLRPGSMQNELAQGDFYRQMLENSSVDDIFPRPQQKLDISSKKLQPARTRKTWVERQQLSFASEFVPVLPAVREPYKRLRRNATAHAQFWAHPDGPRPTLMFLHGFYASQPGLNSRMFSLPWFYRQGYDILLVTMPFHGPRAELLSPFNGAGWFAHGMAHMNEAAFQTIYEMRLWMDYLEQRGAPAIGVSGLSLGGYISALLAAVDDRLAFAIPNSPVVAPVDMALQWQPMASLLRRGLKRSGLPLSELRHVFAAHSPLTWSPRIDADRLMIIGGAGDRFTSPRFVQLLHQHWHGSELMWFPGNHVIHLDQKTYLRRMLSFMRRSI